MIPVYSLIVPVYNEEATLPELYRRVQAVMEQMDGEVELILINDGSRDRSLHLVRELHENDHRVCYLSFARNFGHQIAVTAGLNFARGKAVIVMDADLQDPPELIFEMVDEWRKGYQVVYAQRISRTRYQDGYGWFKRGTAYLFYRILKRLANIDIPTDTGDFCLMDRQVLDILNAMPEQHRYIRGLRAWIGFRQTSVMYARERRFAGEVKYTFQKSLSLAIDGLVSFSKVPLRIATYVGLFAALIALVMVLLIIYWRLFYPHSPLTGYAVIGSLLFFLGSVQLFSIGILGEYIGRIYEQVKGRPLYILDEVAGFASDGGVGNSVKSGT